MLRTTGTAGGNYRDGHRNTNRIDQFDVKAGVGAVLVDAVHVAKGRKGQILNLELFHFPNDFAHR